MKIEKVNSISNATVSAGLILANLASSTVEATSNNGSKATWRKFNAESAHNISEQMIDSSNKTTPEYYHPVFQSEDEIRQVLKTLEGISSKNPTTSSEIFDLIKDYRLRRDLHLRLGNLGEAMCDEQRLIHFEKLFDQASNKEMRDIMGETWVNNNAYPAHIAEWKEGHAKFREGLSHLAFTTPPYPFIPGEKEKGIAALNEAAKAGIPEALLILKALDQPLPKSSNTEEWLSKALSGDYKGALKDLEALLEDDLDDYTILTQAALVHYLNGDKLAASGCLWQVRSAWQQNYGVIMPDLNVILSDGMYAAEIQKLFHL